MSESDRIADVAKALDGVLLSANSHVSTVAKMLEIDMISGDDAMRLFGDLMEEIREGVEIVATDFSAKTARRVMTLQSAHLLTCQSILNAIEQAKAKGKSLK